MTMIFAQMNNIIPQAAPAGKPGSGSPNQGRGQDALNGFAGRLENEVRKLNTPPEEGGYAGNDGMAEGESGVKFLSRMEQVLLKISGGNLSDIEISQEGLDSLEQLLIMAGFDPEDVSGILAALKEKAGKEGLDLKTVMDSLAQLETVPKDAEKETEVFLETSAVPFLTTLLETFGLSKADVESLVESADKGQKGISLNILVQELRSLLERLPSSVASMPAQQTGIEISKMLGHLNMALPENTAGEAVTLKDLLSSFDAYIKSKDAAGNAEPVLGPESLKSTDSAVSAAADKSGGSMAALMEKFLNGLGTRNGNEVQPEISFVQVKDQLKNELISAGKGEKGKPGLLSQGKAEAAPDALMKNLEQVMSKSASGDAAGRHGGNSDTREQGKSEVFKQGDILQNDIGTGKNEVLENRLKGMTAKPAERALPSYVTHQVNRSIVRAVSQGETTLTLQLKPAALGRLSLTIDNTGNSIKVSILTDNHAAKEMLASNVNELKAALSASGISLDSFDVDMNSDFRQSMADAGNQARNFNRKNNGNGKSFSEIEDLDPEDGTAGLTPAGMHLEGSYHFVA